MRDELGVLLVEDEKGEVSVQLFADPAKAREVFQQLTDDKRLRATFLVVDWKKKSVEALTKELPESLEGERPDGWKVGVGPIFFVKPFGIQASGGDIRADKKEK
jgi:hypothetical protein